MSKFNVPPGSCVAVLGVIAAIYTIMPTDFFSPLWRLVLILVITALGVGEILVLQKERTRQTAELIAAKEDAHARFVLTLKQFEGVREAAEAHTLALLRLNQIVDVPARNIKKKALQLSESLTNFVYDRLQNSPGGFGRRPTLADLRQIRTPLVEVMRQSLEYDGETLALYKKDLYPAVSDMRDELENRGLNDPELDALFTSPKTTQDMLRVADRIGMLAAKLDATQQ
jgi:hypothetical protein